jgi:hypothetical protein
MKTRGLAFNVFVLFVNTKTDRDMSPTRSCPFYLTNRGRTQVTGGGSNMIRLKTEIVDQGDITRERERGKGLVFFISSFIRAAPTTVPTSTHGQSRLFLSVFLGSQSFRAISCSINSCGRGGIGIGLVSESSITDSCLRASWG